MYKLSFKLTMWRHVSIKVRFIKEPACVGPDSEISETVCSGQLKRNIYVYIDPKHLLPNTHVYCHPYIQMGITTVSPFIDYLFWQTKYSWIKFGHIRATAFWTCNQYIGANMYKYQKLCNLGNHATALAEMHICTMQPCIWANTIEQHDRQPKLLYIV